MAKLSPKKQALLEQLQAESEAPERPSIGKSVQVIINLGNKDEVEMARKYGFLDDGDDDVDTDDDDDDDADDAPVRKGFFDK